MLRIFLVIEDSNQMNSLKVVLSKLGCIVETVGVELGLRDRLLAFRPEVVITAGTGKKINPLAVTQKIRETGKDIKVLLLLGKGMKISLNDLAENRYDAFIESPFEPLRLITTINQFNKGKNNIDLVEKYQKIMAGSFASNQESRIISNKKLAPGEEKQSGFGAKFSTSVDNATRVKSYEDLTFGLTLEPKSMISKSAARVKVAELQKDWDRKKLDEIDEEKRRFVKELFRKK